MSKKDEALKLALVAERVLKAWDDPQGMPALCEEMNCLREALAEQPAQQQEPVEWLTGCPECGMDGGCDCDSGTWNPPAQQEPVAEVKLKERGGNAGIATVIHEIFDPMREPLRVGDKLYTSPQSKPWVGLTPEERQACTQSPFTSENYLAIEAKLMEKNT